jgi:hypothetical protein
VRFGARFRYKPKKEIADKTHDDLMRNRTQLLKEAEQYN